MKFLAWDSEGYEIRGSHELICVCNSAGGTLAKDGDRLSPLACLRFIASSIDCHSSHTHIIFGGSYDANMWLRDFPRDQIELIWNGQTGRFADEHYHYKVRYFPRKSFSVHVRRAGYTHWYGGIIWDVVGFFQSTFITACKKYGIDLPPEVKVMKDSRRDFRIENFDAIVRYCKTECRALVRLCDQLARNAFAAGIHPRRWDGAGAFASELLRMNNVQDFMGEQLPPQVDLAARYAYFGGRIEASAFGFTTSNIWKYDINSAYPAAAANLPCLAHGRWRETKSFDPSSYGVWRVRARTRVNNSMIAALPYRAKDGRVYFPWEVEGWYWTPEIARLLWAGRVRVIRGYVWDQLCDHKPFSWLARLYSMRQRMKAEGNGVEKALKLGINAVYGKLAQTVGMTGRIPRWHNLAWAGYITSETRAKLFSYGYEANADLVAIATDAIFTRQPLRSIEPSEHLGGWSLDTYNGMTIVQSGIYWLGDNELAYARRGFHSENLKRAEILSGWREQDENVQVKQTLFIGMGIALQGRWDQWCSWREDDRHISLWPNGTKRAILKGGRPERQLMQTQPADPYAGDIIPISWPIYRPWDNLGAEDAKFEPRELTEALSWKS